MSFEAFSIKQRRRTHFQVMYCVYILKTKKDNRYYKGYTSLNVYERLKQHNLGNCKYTKKYKPWEIEFYCMFNDKIKAIKFEKYLKTASGIAFSRKRFI